MFPRCSLQINTEVHSDSCDTPGEGRRLSGTYFIPDKHSNEPSFTFRNLQPETAPRSGLATHQQIKVRS